jgi:membrane protein YdbS with pleckstrin-like domain
MPTETSMNPSSSKVISLSLDTWVLIVAVVLALAVRFGILDNVPW